MLSANFKPSFAHSWLITALNNKLLLVDITEEGKVFCVCTHFIHLSKHKCEKKFKTIFLSINVCSTKC